MKSFFKKYRIKIILILFIVITCGTLAYISTPKKGFKLKPPKIDWDEVYEVVSVLDGDTFEVKIGKSIWKVRLLGVDTPETVDPTKPVQCFGKEASDKTKELLLNHSVKLSSDPTQDPLDKFNRLLAYVYVDEIFVNKYLIQNGYAREYTYSKAYEQQKEFRKLEKESEKNKTGMWGSLCFQK